MANACSPRIADPNPTIHDPYRTIPRELYSTIQEIKNDPLLLEDYGISDGEIISRINNGEYLDPEDNTIEQIISKKILNIVGNSHAPTTLTQIIDEKVKLEDTVEHFNPKNDHITAQGGQLEAKITYTFRDGSGDKYIQHFELGSQQQSPGAESAAIALTIKHESPEKALDYALAFAIQDFVAEQDTVRTIDERNDEGRTTHITYAKLMLSEEIKRTTDKPSGKKIGFQERGL